MDELIALSRRYLETRRKSYQRSIDPKVFKHRLSILIGQRGVGKTTSIIQYLLQQVKNDILSREILYVPADHFLLGTLSFYEIAEHFVQHGGKIIVFDEIHKYKEWSKELKSIYDTFPELKIIASGSSALEINRGSHDLVRRSVVHTIDGLSFREYLELNLDCSFAKYKLNEITKSHEKIAKDVLNSVAEKKQKIIPLFNQYLQTGYYPYFLEFGEADLYFTTLEQNFHAIIEVDLPAIYSALTGDSIRKIKQLLSFIAAEVPFIPQWSKLKNLVGIGDERTLKTYFKYLEEAGLIRMISRASRNMHKLETPEKIYFSNPNQLYAISKQAQNIGTVREAFFLSMLQHEHEVAIPANGDFMIDSEVVFEVGGKKKDFSQIRNVQNAYLACADIEEGVGKKIPLWAFGFLY